jgi:K+-transporting ATPase ATPase A chain
MAILVALIRGIARNTAKTIGNFWVDLTRSVLYILLPLSLILALALVSQGVVQTFQEFQTVTLIQSYAGTNGQVIDQQTLAVGPAASQIAIKQLGTNGGGFFNTNSSHPLENPTPLANFLELLSILLIPAALCYTFGVMVDDTRQGWSLLVVMTLIFIAFLWLAVWSEYRGNPALSVLGVDQTATDLNTGGNMEGKEVRFGIANSALWETATTAASNGSVNSMHDSYTPLGGLVALVMMQLGEVVFGGVGSGLYGMLAFVIVAVFVSGLMVGRTPEYLGKKIEAYEMKMASLVILIMPLVVLGFTALAVVTEAGRAAVANPGPHGFSEILYAFTSQGNNNGSAFAGLNANTPFYDMTGALAMFLGRFFLAVPTLALAGSLGRKKIVPASAGTMPTHTPLFVVLLISVVLIVALLTFIPVDALGPIVEHLMMIGH